MGFRGMTPGIANDHGAWVKSFGMVGWWGTGNGGVSYARQSGKAVGCITVLVRKPPRCPSVSAA